MGVDAQAILSRVQQLRAQVKRHKKAVGIHRELLQAAATELRGLEERCRALGIAIVINTPAGVGDIHGPASPDS